MRTGSANLASSLNHPFGAGIVAILLIASVIFLVGDSQAERGVVSSVSSQHQSDISRIASVLHHSSLPLSGEDVRESLPSLAATGAFDAAARRAMFGLRAARLDLYTLDGEPLYSTAPGDAPPLHGGGLDAFQSAVSGEFTSLLRPPSSAQADLGQDAEALQSFTIIRDVSPESFRAGRPLMVAAISTDVSGEIQAAYDTIWLVVGVFAGGSLVILAAVHWVSVRSRSRLQAANDALAAQNEAVRESRERMIAMADMTKRAISEELHGSVQTKIFALWMRLGQVKAKLDKGEKADMNELEAVISELDDVREKDIRGLSHRLHPSIVRVGAALALKALCSGMSGPVKVELKIDQSAADLEPLGASQVPEQMRLAVYRIAELAIGNTIKHASASRCVVTWSYSRDNSQLQLTVEDDGVGFDAGNAVPSGLGIVNIQDYTDAMDGHTEIISRPGHGTTLKVTIPFKAPPDQLLVPARSKRPALDAQARAA